MTLSRADACVGARGLLEILYYATADILRWAWNRETPGAVSPLRIDGDIEGLTEFRACVVVATQ
jgi:hypothetical protein